VFGTLAAVAALFFTENSRTNRYFVSFPFPLFPLFVCVALRFGVKGSALALFVLALIAIWNTGHGRGPFAEPGVPPRDHLLIVQFFLSSVALAALALSAALAERRAAQDALRENEARYRQVVETAFDAIVTTDGRGAVVGWNRSAERVFGYAAAEVVGRNIEFVIPARFRVAHAAALSAFDPARPSRVRGQVLEQVAVRKGGDQFPVELAITRWDTGTGPYFTAVVRDVTDRACAAAALRESEARYREVTETIDEAFWVIRPAHTGVIYISPAYARIWGRSCDSLYANPLSFAEAIHPDDRARVIAALPKQEQGTYNEEYRIVRPDGTVRWVRSRAFALRDEAGNVMRIVGVTQDVTERKDAELAKESLIDELQKALAEVRTLRGMIPVCAWCRKVRADGGFWQSVEEYICTHTDAQITHGMCPACFATQMDSIASHRVG
jgi:PAS domain S-box-containing protein